MARVSKAAVELARKLDPEYGDNGRWHFAEQAIQDAVEDLVKSASGESKDQCEHPLSSQFQMNIVGWIVCCDCIHAALKPWTGGEDGE